MEVLKKFKKSAYAVTIVYIIIGLIMLLNPSFIGDAVNYVLGVLIIIYGLIYSIGVYQKKEEFDKFNLFAGIICISFGLFLIVNKNTLVSLIPFSMGVVLLMDAIGGIIKSFKLKRLGLTRWWIVLVVSILFLGFAIYIIVKANDITELLIRFIGGFLIVDAIMDVLMGLRLAKETPSEVRDIKVIED